MGECNQNATGPCSHAEGIQTTADGAASHAQGYLTTVTGPAAHAQGYLTHADGYASHAQGYLTASLGDASHAEGGGTSAGGLYSHAEGQNTIATGPASHAQGFNTTAISNYAHTEGAYTLGAHGTLYKITAFNDTTKTITLDTVSGLYVGDVLQIKIVDTTALVNVPISVINGFEVTLDTTLTLAGSTHAVKLESSVQSTVHAEGVNTIASGYASHAEGEDTAASGLIAHAEGYATTASGILSHAEGSGTIASGRISHAEGEQTVASSDYAHTEGIYTLGAHGTLFQITSYDDTTKTISLDTVSGLSVGDVLQIKILNARALVNVPISGINGLDVTLNTTSTLNDAVYAIQLDNTQFPVHVEGVNTIASGYAAHAEGVNTVAREYAAHAEGEETVASSYSAHAEGYLTTASGEFSHAEGFFTTASGDSSHAEGASTTASNNASHAEGGSTTAGGQFSHAEGLSTTASGYASHAEGRSTNASGYTSHAEGADTTASGTFSHTEGYGTTANVFASHTMGAWNNPLSGDTLSYSAAADAFVIGNGTDVSTLGNAFRITFSGAAYGLSAFNSTGADYAEYFEWQDGNPDNEDRVGYFVTMDGLQIRKASGDDYILGVVSTNPAVIGNSHQENWNAKYVTDEWERIQCHYIDVPAVYDKDGKEIQPARKDYVPMLNPDWDPSKEYIPREKRKEWAAVGMMGQLLVRDDGTCEVNSYCKVNGEGMATASTSGYRVIQRLAPTIVRILLK